MGHAVKTISATQARNQLAELMEKTYFQGERFVLERQGIPMSVLISVQEYEQWRTGHSTQPETGEDPLAAFAGIIESGIPDLAARHDDYLGEALGRDLGGANHA